MIKEIKAKRLVTKRLIEEKVRDKTRFWGLRLPLGVIVFRPPGCPKIWERTFPLSIVSRVAPASEVVNNKNPSAQTRFRLFSDSPLHIEPKGLPKFTLRRDTADRSDNPRRWAPASR
jgi:hypothetical protein